MKQDTEKQVSTLSIGVLREANDTRVAWVPETLKKIVSDKVKIFFEKGCGSQAWLSDKAYEEIGAVTASRSEILKSSDIIATINPLSAQEEKKLKKDCCYISLFKPYEPGSKIKDQLAPLPVRAFSLDMIPRSSIAQSMDVLSSMASIAGYKAVLMAANKLPKYFPMLITSAGSIKPAKVLVIGAGVAGLQAIATAKRLGATVEAMDTRAAAAEEVQSLGGKFIQLEGAKDDKAAGGYGVEQSKEFIKQQQQRTTEILQNTHAVICTAVVRGRKAPVIITKKMVESMREGSIIIDLAASSGGNCEVTKDNETIVKNGVTIVGNSYLPSEMPTDASTLFSNNTHNFVKLLITEEGLSVDMENEILSASCIHSSAKK